MTLTTSNLTLHSNPTSKFTFIQSSSIIETTSYGQDIGIAFSLPHVKPIANGWCNQQSKWLDTQASHRDSPFSPIHLHNLTYTEIIKGFYTAPLLIQK
ncbi:hypothetical protein HYC85_031126 [Camellia sinensis]|uniref:Uncharacterized protein n=1 Tax=Camellia sinensis TaxID=4442 RepID=A0A7J7FPW5_CAMSI|nr:hypothetical protein HYC85_031126 [Camellia sinensis]